MPVTRSENHAMAETGLSFRPLHVADLTPINDMIKRCVWGWQLSDRTKRLVQQSYCYQPDDFDHMALFAAEWQQDTDLSLIGMVALEPVELQSTQFARQGSVLLHGIYIAPEMHRQGLGRALMRFAEDQARTRFTAKSLWVKAQVDANGFFAKAGFAKVPIDDEGRDYPHRWVKAL